MNATPNDETGLGEELSTMGVRKPGLRTVGHEMPSKARFVYITPSLGVAILTEFLLFQGRVSMSREVSYP